MAEQHQMYPFINGRHCCALKCSCGRVMNGGAKTTHADLISDHLAEIEEGTAV